MASLWEKTCSVFSQLIIIGHIGAAITYFILWSTFIYNTGDYFIGTYVTFWFKSKHIIFNILFNIHFVSLGATHEKIFDVGHKAIDTVEEGVHTGSNGLHGVINDIEDQTGQHNFDWNSSMEHCFDHKNPIECIRDNLIKGQ